MSRKQKQMKRLEALQRRIHELTGGTDADRLEVVVYPSNPGDGSTPEAPESAAARLRETEPGSTPASGWGPLRIDFRAAMADEIRSLRQRVAGKQQEEHGRTEY